MLMLPWVLAFVMWRGLHWSWEDEGPKASLKRLRNALKSYEEP